MDYNLSSYPYPSRRRVIMARRGMVCTGQPLAAQAGLRMLLQGGNAVDAALATAICLTVVEPDCNGLGSDAFALVWIKDRLYGLNGRGPAPALLTRDKVLAAGYAEMPQRGWVPVAVPGAVAAWAALPRRVGFCGMMLWRAFGRSGCIQYARSTGAMICGRFLPTATGSPP